MVPDYNIPDISSPEYIDYLMKNFVTPKYFDSDGYAHYRVKDKKGDVVDIKGYHMNRYKVLNEYNTNNEETNLAIDTAVEVLNNSDNLPVIGQTLGYTKDLASFYSGYKGAMSFHNWNYQRKMNNMMFDTLTSYDLNTYLTMREGFGLGTAALGGKLGRTIEEKTIAAVGGGKVLDDVTKDAYNKVVTNVPIKSNEEALIERMDKLINESKGN